MLIILLFDDTLHGSSDQSSRNKAYAMVIITMGNADRTVVWGSYETLATI